MSRLLLLLAVGLVLSACGGPDRGGDQLGADQLGADQKSADRTMRDALEATRNALDGEVVSGRGSWITCDLGQGIQYAANAQVRTDQLPADRLDQLTTSLQEAGFQATSQDPEHAQADRDGLSVKLLLGHPPQGPYVVTLSLDTDCAHYGDAEDQIREQPTTSYLQQG
jgi:hypothetical protein